MAYLVHVAQNKGHCHHEGDPPSMRQPLVVNGSKACRCSSCIGGAGVHGAIGAVVMGRVQLMLRLLPALTILDLRAYCIGALALRL